MGRTSDANGYMFFEDVHGEKSSPDTGELKPKAEVSFDFKRVLVYDLFSVDDVQKLIDYLKSRQPAIINLEKTEPELARQFIATVSGAIYALNGSMVRISGNIFLLSPEGVSITYSQELT